MTSGSVVKCICVLPHFGGRLTVGLEEKIMKAVLIALALICGADSKELTIVVDDRPEAGVPPSGEIVAESFSALLRAITRKSCQSS
jgi:hypothetical protein